MGQAPFFVYIRACASNGPTLPPYGKPGAGAKAFVASLLVDFCPIDVMIAQNRRKTGNIRQSEPDNRTLIKPGYVWARGRAE